MKRLLAILLLLTIFAVAYASMSYNTRKYRERKKPVNSERKCSYHSDYSII